MTVVLPVLTRGDAVSLVGRDITIMLVDPNERKTPVSFTVGGVDNNIATFVVEGTSQTATGTYRAEVYENYRGTAMAVYDCDIFVLVARTEYENDGNEGVSSETTTLDPINIAWVGRDGYTPYIQDGYWYINGTSTNVKAAGENGDTPYIENGYWYIGGVSTGIKVDYTNEEAQRSAAEQVRVVAEDARVQAEAARTLAENSRLTEESGRSAAEGVRILAERDRQAEEAMRQTNEETRVDNEEARVEAELGRAASEASRAQVEATRVANESARTTAEATRAANEQARVSEESDRAAAETARIAAETARETAEGGRTSAEATRVSNEQTRVSNESTRQSNESARQSAESARQAAYVAAENARDAAFAEKEATRDAANQAALDCADELAALGPKIDNLDFKFQKKIPEIEREEMTISTPTVTIKGESETNIVEVAEEGVAINGCLTINGENVNNRFKDIKNENNTSTDASISIIGRANAELLSVTPTEVKVPTLWVTHLKDGSGNDYAIGNDYTDVISLNRDVENAVLQSTMGFKGDNLERKQCLTIAVFTDIHGDGGNLARFVEYCNHYNSLIHDRLCLGDMITTDFDSSMSFFDAVSGAEDILLTIGNHDTKKPSENVWTYYAGKDAYDKYFAPYIDNWNVTQPTDAATNGYCWYYKDYADVGVRLIVLDAMLGANSAMNATQLAWFQSVLDDALTNCLAVVCASHAPSNITIETDNGFSTLDYPSYGSTFYGLDREPYFDAVDDFIDGGGEFISWFAGDTHRDMQGLIVGHQNQYVITFENASANSVWNDSMRARNTKSGDSFNIVTFDTYSKMVRIVRIGDNIDRHLRHKTTMEYNYSTHTLISQN